MLPVHCSEPVTPPQDGLRPIWLPEVDPAVSKQPTLNAVKWLQTSARPDLTLKNESESVDNDGGIDVPASIQPATNQQTLLDGGGGAEDSKWSSNQYHSQNKNAEQRSSMPAYLVDSESDEKNDDVFLNKTRSEKNHCLFQKVG